jgi:hypothetical protein
VDYSEVTVDNLTQTEEEEERLAYYVSMASRIKGLCTNKPFVNFRTGDDTVTTRRRLYRLLTENKLDPVNYLYTMMKYYGFRTSRLSQLADPTSLAYYRELYEQRLNEIRLSYKSQIRILDKRLKLYTLHELLIEEREAFTPLLRVSVAVVGNLTDVYDAFFDRAVAEYMFEGRLFDQAYDKFTIPKGVVCQSQELLRFPKSDC